MQRFTTHPAPAHESAQPASGLLSSALFVRLHLALTALLIASLVVVGVLAVAGQLRFGKTIAAEVEKPRSQEREGRYQIEAADDVRQELLEIAKLGGLLDSRVREAWVYRYKGGFLETTLATDLGGEPHFSTTLPQDQEWGRLLAEQGVKLDDPEALNKEGRLILVGLIKTVSIEQALQPLHLHLGAAFTKGPAGPLHSLLPYYLDVEKLIEYRVFTSVGPPKGKKGPSFTMQIDPWLPIRSHLVTGAEFDQGPQVKGSKNVEPGKKLTILERPLGKSTIRLDVRFLTDREAVERSEAASSEP